MSEATTMTKLDTMRLLTLERTVEKGLATFVEVGNALKEIRDARLYRESWKTFDAYVEDRFSLKRSRAYQLIDAATVTEEMSNIVGQTPANARVAAELARVEPEARAEVWAEVLEQHDEPTAADVRAVVEQRKEEVEPEEARPSRKERIEQVETEHAAVKAKVAKWVKEFRAIGSVPYSLKELVVSLSKSERTLLGTILESF